MAEGRPDPTDAAAGEPALRRPFSHRDTAVSRRVVRPLQEFLRTSSASAMLLLAAVVVALVWANSPWSASYVRLWSTVISIRVGDWALSGDLSHWIDDGLMTIFFLVVGLEIKRELTTGELRAWRAAAVPAVAAIGGMVVPALIFVALNAGSPAGRGWGIPMATDIAFALGALTLAAAYAPAALKPLLLTLAIVDDIGAIVVIALFYSGGIATIPLLLAVAIVLAIVGLQRIHVRAALPYLVLGVGLWYATLRSGVHPTIAGVILGLLTPARPFQRPAAVSAEARRVADATSDVPEPPDEDALMWMRLSWLSKESVSPLARVEHILLPWSSFVILPVFALANAGVELSRSALANVVTSPLGLGILLGLVLGKPIGVLSGSFLAVRTRLGVLDPDVGWGDLTGMGATAGIGFTVALFIAELAFPGGRDLDVAKVAILVASTLAAIVGYVLLRLSPGPARPSEDQSAALSPPG
ncbi:MAG: Na+/H+ antiporter NhaA [Actinomycetota bacterium]